MEIVRCEKGHFYDAEVNSSCPQCALEAQNGGVSGYGPTEPIGPTEQAGATIHEPPGPMVRCAKGHVYDLRVNSSCPQCALEARGGRVSGYDTTEPLIPGQTIGETVPVTDRGFTPTDFDATGGNTPRVQRYEPTMPVPQGGVAGFNPVVGWLVCVDGADKGTDYRIRNGNNYIGRDQSMDICIRNDNHISNQNAAIIGYDDLERQFFFGPAGGHNTVRVNGKMVINAVPLSPYDEITVGTTKLMFVPLCGERFDWNAK